MRGRADLHRHSGLRRPIGADAFEIRELKVKTGFAVAKSEHARVNAHQPDCAPSLRASLFLCSSYDPHAGKYNPVFIRENFLRFVVSTFPNIAPNGANWF